MECITYKQGYKYQLSHEYSTDIAIKPSEYIASTDDYVTLSTQGRIVIKPGYAWDGPSGPAIDTLTFMRASLVHDALYQLMREQKLSKHAYKELADRILQRLCKEDGMNALRAWWVYQAVSKLGSSAADQNTIKAVIAAPESCQ